MSDVSKLDTTSDLLTFDLKESASVKRCIMNPTSKRKRLLWANVVVFMTLFSAPAQIGNTGTLDTWTTKPVSREHPQASQLSYVRIVRAAKQSDSDRVVFEFVGPFPNYRVEYLKGHFYDTEGGRERIKSAGNVFLQVDFNMIPASEDQLKFTEAKGFIPKGKLRMSSVQSVADQGLFEGFYDFVIGVAARKPFRVTELSNPPRLVVDFKH
jgi:hypothetical protein